MPQGFAFDKMALYQNGTRVREINGTTAFILGEEINHLEQQVCRQLQVPYCVSTYDVEWGLFLALRASGVQTGDRVLCSGMAPLAVARAIRRAGGIPMPVDVNPNTFSMDPYCLDYVAGKCQRMEQPLPRVVVASDTFGLTCNYPALEAVCEKHGMALIEDMSGAFGAMCGGKPAGSFGRFAVASLSPEEEPCDTGEGAAVICHSESDRLRLRRLQTELDNGVTDDAVDAACKCSVQAGIARGWLEHISRRVESRRRIAGEYWSHLEGQLRMQAVPEGFLSAYSRFVVALPDPVLRERIIGRLQKREIPCMAPRPVFDEPQPGEAWDRVELRNTKNAYGKLVFLPIHAHLTSHVAAKVTQELLGEVQAEYV